MECFQAFKYTSFEVAGNESSTFLFDIVLCAHVVLPMCWYPLIRFSIWMFSLLSGDDYDIGKVTGYRFVIAENYSALLDPLAEVQTLVGFQQPDEAGVSTSYQFGLARIDDHYNKDLFLGLLAFDEKDNEGSMSNIGKSLLR